VNGGNSTILVEAMFEMRRTATKAAVTRSR